jgi:hypothetical protein
MWKPRSSSAHDAGVLVKVVVALVGLSLVGSACTKGSGSDPPVRDPRARLDALAERWMTTRATITYTTTQRDPGEATSPHQCLRQFVGDTVDRQTGLMICSGAGEMRLVWEPPDRWRMDEVSPGRSLELISTPDGDVRCRIVDPFAPRCVAAERVGRFGSLVGPPALTLDEIGAPVTAEAGRVLAGIRSECFMVEGGPVDAIHRAEWCYSGDGLLLFALDRVEGGRVTIAEATEVSPRVSERDFTVPST